MPQLKNLRREMFCHMLVEGARYGWSQGTCYMKAGYRTTGHGAEVNAGKLLKNTDIRNRIAELGAPIARKSKLTAESLIGKLDVVFDGSVTEKQYSAAGRAVEVQGKLAGLMVDRVEHGGPGAFDQCQTPSEVIAKLLEDQAPAEALATLELLRTLIEQQASSAAVVVEELPRDQVDRGALALLKQRKPSRRN